MSETYVEKRDGGYWVSGTRVSLDSLVYGFREGMSAERIADNFPVLSLEQVYGVIAYYLKHQEEIDNYLRQIEADAEALKQQIRADYPALNQKLDEARKQLEPIGS